MCTVWIIILYMVKIAGWLLFLKIQGPILGNLRWMSSSGRCRIPGHCAENNARFWLEFIAGFQESVASGYSKTKSNMFMQPYIWNLWHRACLYSPWPLQVCNCSLGLYTCVKKMWSCPLLCTIMRWNACTSVYKEDLNFYLSISSLLECLWGCEHMCMCVCVCVCTCKLGLCNRWKSIGVY